MFIEIIVFFVALCSAARFDPTANNPVSPDSLILRAPILAQSFPIIAANPEKYIGIIERTMCSNSKVCPTYSCSLSPPWTMFDEFGCAICPTPTWPTIPAPSFDEPTCGPCSQKLTTTLLNGLLCTECHVPKASYCPEIRCASTKCNYGTINTVSTRCCHYCAGECQQTASSKCKTIACDSTIKCAPGAQLTTRFDANGCEMCPICKKGCPLRRCPELKCNKCSMPLKAVDKNGCNSCPVCGIRPDLHDLPACDGLETEEKCAKTFAYIRADESGCCRITSQCLDEKCSNMYCEELTCIGGQMLTELFDEKGCKICPICK